MQKLNVIVIFTTLFCLFTSISIESYCNIKPHFVIGIGNSFFTDFGSLEPHVLYKMDTNGLHNSGVKRPVSYGTISYGLYNQFNLFAFNKENSISLNFFPSAGFSWANYRTICFSTPLTLQYNNGSLSSYSSKRDNGFTVGIGYELVHGGLVNYSAILYNKDYLIDGRRKKTFYRLQPCITFGYRYKTKKQVKREVNIKFGMTKRTVYDKYKMAPKEDIVDFNVFWFRLMWVHFKTKRK